MYVQKTAAFILAAKGLSLAFRSMRTHAEELYPKCSMPEFPNESQIVMHLRQGHPLTICGNSHIPPCLQPCPNQLLLLRTGSLGTCQKSLWRQEVLRDLAAKGCSCLDPVLGHHLPYFWCPGTGMQTQTAHQVSRSVLFLGRLSHFRLPCVSLTWVITVESLLWVLNGPQKYTTYFGGPGCTFDKLFRN